MIASCFGKFQKPKTVPQVQCWAVHRSRRVLSKWRPNETDYSAAITARRVTALSVLAWVAPRGRLRCRFAHRWSCNNVTVCFTEGSRTSISNLDATPGASSTQPALRNAVTASTPASNSDSAVTSTEWRTPRESVRVTRQERGGTGSG